MEFMNFKNFLTFKCKNKKTYLLSSSVVLWLRMIDSSDSHPLKFVTTRFILLRYGLVCVDISRLSAASSSSSILSTKLFSRLRIICEVFVIDGFCCLRSFKFRNAMSTESDNSFYKKEKKIK